MLTGGMHHAGAAIGQAWPPQVLDRRRRATAQAQGQSANCALSTQQAAATRAAPAAGPAWLRIRTMPLQRSQPWLALALVTAPPPMPAQAAGSAGEPSGPTPPATTAAAAAPSRALRSTPCTCSSCRPGAQVADVCEMLDTAIMPAVGGGQARKAAPPRRRRRRRGFSPVAPADRPVGRTQSGLSCSSAGPWPGRWPP